MKTFTEGMSIPSIFQMQEMSRELQRDTYKMFFDAGGIPDHADNGHDFKMLEGLFYALFQY